MTTRKFREPLLAVLLLPIAMACSSIPARERHSISGTIFDMSGENLSGATVATIVADDRVTVVTREEGHYEFSKIFSPGRYQLEVKLDGYVPGSFEVDVGDRDVAAYFFLEPHTISKDITTSAALEPPSDTPGQPRRPFWTRVRRALSSFFRGATASVTYQRGSGNAYHLTSHDVALALGRSDAFLSIDEQRRLERDYERTTAELERDGVPSEEIARVAPRVLREYLADRASHKREIPTLYGRFADLLKRALPFGSPATDYNDYGFLSIVVPSEKCCRIKLNGNPTADRKITLGTGVHDLSVVVESPIVAQCAGKVQIRTLAWTEYRCPRR